ncbi:MarR family winged helix-turn-helix transcriptional regulator [Sulfitobacter sp. PS-8MA]|uniref:MarR family winged helix-turn-helix transcriptional regulator n=1 Tax=Sulfitobacter sp. PS-8MA TaxID=3237707 RepID=UPI0034C63262
MLDQTFQGDLRYLMAVSYIVLSNNQVTSRYIEREYDMPVHAWSALYAITSFPGLRSKDIQHLFPRPQNSISRVVRLLIDRALVREEICAADARAKLLYATAKGAALLREIEAKSLARQTEMFGSLTDAEREVFLSLCRKIAGDPRLQRSETLT